MKKHVLDIQLERLRLGELSDEESQELLDALEKEEGNTDRFDALIMKDEAFLEKYPPSVFAAQVSDRLRREERQRIQKETRTQRKEKKMTLSNKLLAGIAVIGVAGGLVYQQTKKPEGAAETLEKKELVGGMQPHLTTKEGKKCDMNAIVRELIEDFPQGMCNKSTSESFGEASFSFRLNELGQPVDIDNGDSTFSNSDYLKCTIEEFGNWRSKNQRSCVGFSKHVLGNAQLKEDLDEIEKIVLKKTELDNIPKFQRFYKKYIVGEAPDDMLWFYDQYAALLERIKPYVATKAMREIKALNAPKAEELREAIISNYQALPEEKKQNLDLSKKGIAKSFIKSANKDLATTVRIRLDQPQEEALKNSLAEKQKGLAKAENAFQSAIAMGIPKFSMIAHHRIAIGYRDAAESVRDSYIPPRLTAKQERTYRKVLDDVAKKMEVVALKNLHVLNELNVRNGEPNVESQLLRESLMKKLCPTKKDTELLHAMVFYAEHPSDKKDLSLMEARRLGKKLGARSDTFLPEIKPFRMTFLRYMERMESRRKRFLKIRDAAETLRIAMDDWVCVPKDMHEDFHTRLPPIH